MNHFIEVCLDTEDNVWLMLHSGSRNIGKEIADRHINTAKSLHDLNTLPDPALAYLVEGSTEFTDYMHDLHWAQEYALMNRVVMLDNFKEAVVRITGKDFKPEFTVNCHHNYVAAETHFGDSVWVTRKGAINASKGTYGIIPGSMGTKSYIIEGMGNPDSFNSCSHGAGRTMSRTQARKLFTEKDILEQTSGVECRKDISIVDEIPSAYKDIDTVMENQKDLVTVVAELKQIICVKG